jgi:anionic cell wall polymer biosynthesis LytR-Cps2A-Psr (LCP) family protein
MKNYFKNRKKLKLITMEKKQILKRRRYIALFTLFIVFLATISIMVLLREYDYDLSKIFGSQTQETTDSEQHMKQNNIDMKDDKNILLAVHSTDKNEIYYIAILNMQLDKRQISICPLSVKANASVNGRNQSLEGHLEQGGAKQFAQAITANTNVEFDRYIVTNEKNFKTIIRSFGNFTLTLDDKISYSGNDFTLSLLKGKQTIAGDTLLKYIRFQEKSGFNYLNKQADILCDLIDQCFSEKNVGKGEDLFNDFINLVSSNITIVDYTNYVEYLQDYVSHENRNPSKTVSLADIKNINSKS